MQKRQNLILSMLTIFCFVIIVGAGCSKEEPNSVDTTPNKKIETTQNSNNTRTSVKTTPANSDLESGLTRPSVTIINE